MIYLDIVDSRILNTKIKALLLYGSETGLGTKLI